MREEGEEASKRRSADAQMSRKREAERERAGINSLGETHCRCNVNPNY